MAEEKKRPLMRSGGIIRPMYNYFARKHNAKIKEKEVREKETNKRKVDVLYFTKKGYFGEEDKVKAFVFPSSEIKRVGLNLMNARGYYKFSQLTESSQQKIKERSK